MNFTPIGYCCNVHPGRTLDEVRQSLQDHALPVKNLTAPDRPLGVGLWLSATTAKQLTDARLRLSFRDWLQEGGLIPYTLNGFPYGDFHQSVVKHQVYQPTWADKSRLEYTLQLASILDDLLPTGSHGTISTLPLGWPISKGSDDRDAFFRSCASNLKQLVNELAELNSRTGRLIVVCIEPEPGCILDSADDVVRFFGDYLGSDPSVREHLGICHDVCHSAVMFEEQSRAVETYRSAELRIGKVQISSALRLNSEGLGVQEVEQALSQLESFAEPRYLHQTVWKSADRTTFFEDLPLAISEVRRTGTGTHGALVNGRRAGELRTHFHVPIFADQLGMLSTTQGEIGECLDAIRVNSAGQELPHLEVETYAWNVLPAAWQPDTLANGIAQELNWLKKIIAEKDHH